NPQRDVASLSASASVHFSPFFPRPEAARWPRPGGWGRTDRAVRAGAPGARPACSPGAGLLQPGDTADPPAPTPPPVEGPLAMKTFLRALRYALPYRKRLVLSILCAFMAAIFWGLNFTAIYPVLTCLENGQSLQVWVDGAIAGKQREIDQLQRE